MQDVTIDDSTESAPGVGAWIARAWRWGGALISAILILTILIWSYRLGVRDAQEVPIIRAMDTPARVQPAEPGGQEAAHQGLEVNEVLAGSPGGTPAPAQLAPAPATLAEEDTPADPAAAPAPQVGPVLDENIATRSIEEDTAAGPVAPETLPPAAPAPAVQDEETVASFISEEIAAAVAQVRQESGDIGAEGARVATSNRPLARPDDLKTDVPVEPDSVDTVPPGTRVIQLGAYDTRNDAEGEWTRLFDTHWDLLGGRKRYIEEATQAGRVFYRLRAVGFESYDETRALCAALKAREIDCIPVTIR